MCCRKNTIQDKREKSRGFIAENAMVVSAREEASKIGLDIMKLGGNAFDAMVATDLALLVSYPVAGNIGGGGFMVFRMADGTTGALDYREMAPISATKNMYLDQEGKVVSDKSKTGALAIGVPGTIAGLFEIHNKFGTISIEKLIQPAINLANNGVVITLAQAKRLNQHKVSFRNVNQRRILYDKQWRAGDTIKNPLLAKTLERIKTEGRDGFYKGKTADFIVNKVQNLGGIITTEDLENYNVKWRDPIIFNYNDHKIISMPPPSSGGICLAQILKTIEPFNISQYKHNSSKYIQLIVEAERRSYADRAYFLGDPDFVDIPTDSLTSNKYLSQRMKSFNWNKATKSSELSRGSFLGYESDETTHYSIVDHKGNSVSVTTTLNGAYGSKVFVDKGGFFLNNEMDDFSAKPGTPNMFGLIGAEANSIVAKKRMLSSMSPTIIETNAKLKMVLGTPGGSTIITTVLQNIINVLDYKMTMQESVSKPRFHHQWFPDNIKFETSFDTTVFSPLKKLGYKVDTSNFLVIGKTDAILVLPDGRLEGGADPRGDDKAEGF
ncbi:gamma-glutamyltransferase [Flavobacteriaceae bacterium]|jgi:gamma-glutamyltranspeptidase/glutathione hydrolase|nr:gamma-glutamyltransferase [Flavobacteriaceae bacterium]|tara:strand:- start:5155 stop:6810 length:1656 start_codon:yes stop_codon:yes gene_type:complete